jgi:DNA polymerase I-like protein with 3'-5' exonuclease and polymerase domains
MPSQAALFLGTPADTAYLPHIKRAFGGVATFLVCDGSIKFLTHLELYCAKRKVDRVACTDPHILKLLIGPERKPSIADYAGSLFTHKGIEIVFLPPLAQIFTVPYGKFFAERIISKIIYPSRWPEPTTFSWELATPSNLETFAASLNSAILLACDIETFSNPLSIRCIGYTAFFESPLGARSSQSIVLPIDSLFNLAWMRAINNHPVPKVFQNGKYDAAYLLRYNAPPRAWYYDTAHFMHSWYSELPKDLGYLNAFFLRSVIYWKDLAETNDLHEYYRYCALDTWATGNVFLTQLATAPDWAIRNYILEFPTVAPCILSEMTGILRDMEVLKKAEAEALAKQSQILASLRTMLGSPGFNPSSPPQVKKLLHILGCKDLESSDEKNLLKAAFRHPLNARILNQILEYRGERKLSSTYLASDPEDTTGDAKEFGSPATVLYSLNPHNTDTGRLASRSHAFWCGFNIQNIPRGVSVKQTLRAPDGFVLAECDLEQAESRDTAHVIGDERYITAVSGTKDFHSVNASAFFGVPYEQIYDDARRKTLDKKLRDLAKRVNHGANYCMGPAVLVDTMGLEKIYEAARLLNLNIREPLGIAEFLLSRFHATYAGLQRDYYPYVKHTIITTNLLRSRAYHHTPYNRSAHPDVAAYIESGDWSRYCFGNPDKNKRDLNAYVAHGPQSLNARTLNEAYLRVFYEVALPNPNDFRLHAQIHDSILFSFRVGRDDLADRVQELMQIPVTVRDVKGTCRTFTVPASVKIGSRDGVPSPYWSDVE